MCTDMLTRPNTARPLRIVIDPSALAHNLSRLRHARGGRPPRVWAVAKADAYGHGQAHLLAALAEADGLAVRDVAEAWRVTDLGWRGRILVLGGLFDRHEAGHLPGMSLDLVVGAMDQLDWLASARAARPPAIWLRWSGDLGHAGFDASDYPDAYRRAQALAAGDAHRRSAICCITRTPRKPTSAICATAPSTWRSAACPARSAAATRPRC